MSDAEHLAAAHDDLAAAAGLTAMGQQDWADYLEQVRVAASRPRPRQHRRLRVPLDVMARIESCLELGPQDRAYLPYLPPPGLRDLSAGHLKSPDIRAAALVLRDAWLASLAARAAAGPEPSLQAAVSEIAALAGDVDWPRWIDPGDSEEPAAGTGTDHPSWSTLDASTRTALAGLPAPAEPAARLALLLGIWAGSMSRPRLPGEWQAATQWIAAGTWRLGSIEDLGSARAWSMSTASPAIQDPQAFAAFLSWAYRRASTWPTFSSQDPLIHERVREAGLPEQEGLWPGWIRDAITHGRLEASPASATVLRQAPTIDDLLAELDGLVGLAEVKHQIRSIVATVAMEKERADLGLPATLPELNMVFTGNPGTGKTTVAGLYGRILRALGVLPTGEFHEVTAADLVAGYVGQTALKTRGKIEEADGGILFIDEAYALADSQGGIAGRHGYGHEAINELVAQMEARRGQLVVVVAGYSSKMAGFLEANPGLASRFRDPVGFPDLSDAALVDVITGMAATAGYEFQPQALGAVRGRIASMTRGEGFGNAREMRKLLGVIREHMAARRLQAGDGFQLNLITEADIPAYTAGEVDRPRLQAALERLEGLAGLSSVKAAIKDLAAGVEMQQLRQERGQAVVPVQVGHMAFVGNPGTGKTTVAEQVGDILAALGILRSGHVVTADRGTLVAHFVGQTAARTREAVRQALGGVLFIDEAYALAQGGPADFGQEAIAELLIQMEAHREDLVVILAGYPREIGILLDSNPGFASRVGHRITFEDFTADELRQVAASMARMRGRVLAPEAATALAQAASGLRQQPGFANARTMRNLVDASATRHDARMAGILSQQGASAITDEQLRTIEATDVPAFQTPREYGVYL